MKDRGNIERLRTVFMGTPEFAVPVLKALLDAGLDVAGVYTQSDKPAGRGHKTEAPPVKRLAVEWGLPVYQPSTLRTPEAQQELAALRPDVIVVAAYGKLLPPETLNIPPLGCLNIHPSLLPRYRGPSPVASAILVGDTVTGVTVMKLDEGMDTGPLLAQRETAIGPEETADALTHRLFEMGVALLVEALPAVARGEAAFTPQDEANATITKKLTKEDGLIDWTKPASLIARQVRAFHPWPGSYTTWHDKQLKVMEAASRTGEGGKAGEVLALSGDGLEVATDDGVLFVRRLQEEGRKAVSAREFAAGHPDIVGVVLGS
ncbi:MAG: methionyl-tRNA formyltransferase [SAR202 cluster bacterium]|nr:methionyl-tRNA formyltransferase [SAR202 cluster bacterium]